AAIGAYGRPTPPIATQPPRGTRNPRSAARRGTSRGSRGVGPPPAPPGRRGVGGAARCRAAARLTREEEVGRIVGDAVEDELGQPDLVGPADEDGTDASPRPSPDDRRGGAEPDTGGW